MGIGYGKKGQNAGVMRIPETKTASRRSTTLLLIALIIRYFYSLVPGAGLEPAQP